MLISTTSGFDHDTIKEDLIKSLGGTPTWPLPNLKPSTERDFWRWLSLWTPSAIAWDSIQVDGRSATLRLFWYDHSSLTGGGFAVLPAWEEVKYYTWTDCAHQFEHRLLGNCWHEYTCPVCKRSYEVDSSG